MDWVDGWFESSAADARRQAGIDQVTISCKVSIRDTPFACLNWIKANPIPGIARYVPYIAPSSATLQDDALQYSALSVGVSSVTEIDLDDFFGAYETWSRAMADAPAFLSRVVDDLKRVNPALKFGITLYEDELDSAENPFIDDAHLPASVRAKFDVIRLFLHYRKDGPRYAAYVAQARSYFPNARIVAGVYAYDRIDYAFPCAQHDPARKPCTQEEEIGGFRQALDIQTRLLRQGVVSGLDIFPGYFGAETKLYGSGRDSDELACADAARCVKNTLAMRAMVVSAYESFGDGEASRRRP